MTLDDEPSAGHRAAALLNDPSVRGLIAARRRKYVALSAVMSTLYAAVAIGFAFAPSMMARPVIGAAISLGIVSIAVVMLAGIGLAGYYTLWANTVHDRLLEETVRTVAPLDR